jgi:hypothetical protein
MGGLFFCRLNFDKSDCLNENGCGRNRPKEFSGEIFC